MGFSEIEIPPDSSSETTTLAISVGAPEAAFGRVSGTAGGAKLEVSMKKISSKKTTSINGAMSIERVGRLGRVNMGQATVG
jgi:hypothetical protein